MVIPDYLKEPSLKGYCYGTLEYNLKTKEFILQGDSFMLEFARRLFPGMCSYDRKSRKIKIKQTDRVISDLNWLLLRFPVNVMCESILSKSRSRIIERINMRSNGADLKKTKPPKEFLGKLFPFQQEAVTFMKTNKRVLLADSMGLGKTWSALAAAANVSEYPVLVVCQTHVQKQWQRAIGALFDMGSYQTDIEDDTFTLACKRGKSLAPILKGRTPYTFPNTPFTIIHYGLLQDWSKELLKKNYTVVIFDEIQELRHLGTRKYSAASLLSSQADYVWGCSGTPIYGYGIEIWNVMNIIEEFCLGSIESFSRDWCDGYMDRVVLEPKALNAMLGREGLLLRRKYEDKNVVISLPSVDRKVIDIAHDTKLYDELIAKTVSKAKKYDKASFVIKGKLAREIEQETRQATGIAKADYVAEFVASLIESGEKPLVYAWHHAVHNKLMDRLKKYNPCFITGKQNSTQKDEELKTFAKGESGVCILSLRSAAGIDGLQKNATCCVFAELDWSPAIHSQAETRIARIGVNKILKNVPSFYCVSSTGYDETMQDVLGVKVGQFKGIVGDEPEDEQERKDAEKRAMDRIQSLIIKIKKS